MKADAGSVCTGKVLVSESGEHERNWTMTKQEDHAADAEGLLAAIVFPRDDDVDSLLFSAAERLTAEGVRVHGLLPRYAPDPRSPRCIMYVENLSDGRRFRISQDLGPDASGCRLDPDGLAQACVAARSSLGPETEFVIVNRFGRAEAEGGGARGIIEDCLASGIPLLVAVRDAYEGDWQDFHGGLAETLANDESAVTAWCLRAARLRSHAVPG